MDCIQQLISQSQPGLVWLGNDGWLLWDGAHLLGTDLDLLNPERLTPPPADLTLLAERLDLLMITHGHEDHFNMASCRMLAELGNCQFFIPESCKEKAAALPQKRVQLVRPGLRIARAGAEITCTRAIHGHLLGTVYSGASTLDCGYRLRFGGRAIYQPGDTLLLEEHLGMAPADILFVSPTEHNTWIENSRQLIDRLHPRLALAQHFGTYAETSDNRFWTHGYTDELRESLSPEQRERWMVPEMGEIIGMP